MSVFPGNNPKNPGLVKFKMCYPISNVPIPPVIPINISNTNVMKHFFESGGFCGGASGMSGCGKASPASRAFSACDWSILCVFRMLKIVKEKLFNYLQINTLWRLTILGYEKKTIT